MPAPPPTLPLLPVAAPPSAPLASAAGRGRAAALGAVAGLAVLLLWTGVGRLGLALYGGPSAVWPTAMAVLSPAAAPTGRAHVAVKAEGREANLLDLGAQLMYDLATFGTKDVEKPKYPELTYNVGQDLYLDISGWHVFFKDVKVNGDLRLHTVVAQELGDLIQKGLYSDAEVDSLLGRIPITVGGGKHTVPLAAVVPQRCVNDLKDLCRRAEL